MILEFKTESSLVSQRRPVPKGHTTACRITSEDPGEGFKPSGGSLHELNFRSSSNVWGYFSVGNQSSIHFFSIRNSVIFLPLVKTVLFQENIWLLL